MPEQRDAVILLSGGLDSATTLAIARAAGFRCHALSFRYGQRHAVELEAAARVAASLGAASHRIVAIDLAQFGGSALTADIPVPKDRNEAELGSGIPVTYVPARNTVFLSLALAFAESIRAHDLFIGVTAVDYSGYPDCRPEFIAAFQHAARLGTGLDDLEIHTPLIHLAKREIISRGLELGVDYSLTLSCYDPAPDGTPCGHCDSCLIRKRGFDEAGIGDPAFPA
ncbi:MAG TPA: 7-cyano-7-deazaguanine synthase QueC [Gemmatimonadales bacterium]|nr:7-cyano-7-deazaguanine synthase QueC [Gemmatimonadales bacterium]